jgi:hypothetical protein
MKKNIFTVLLATLALTTTAIGFTACGEEETPSNNTPPTPPAQVNPATDYIFPADSSPITFSQPTDGNGSAFGGRYACVEGYYQVEIPAETEVFYEFSVEQTGLYALYTLSVVEDVAITQYDASVQYIPTDEDGNFVGNPAEEVPPGHDTKTGVLYSKINCPQKYFSANWRATYGFYSQSAQTIKIRFVRIADALHVPENIITTVEAEEVLGKFYADPNANGVTDIATVPFSAKYFYDEDYEIEVTPFVGGETVKAKGFYRMGTEEKPGELIYAMLTDIPVRMFDTAFTELLNEGTSLRLHMATAENGDYLINDYIEFMLNDGNETKACYQNAVNEKGLYPVNKELYEFLNAYVNARGCAGMTEAEKNAYPDAMWLAPCYFYGDMSNGSQLYPFALNYGENTITLKNQSYIFYNVRWQKESNDSTGKDINQGFVDIVCNNPNVVLKFINDDTHKNYVAPFELSLETDVLSGVTVMLLYTGDLAEEEVTISVEKSKGTDTNPIEIVNDEMQLSIKKRFLLDGTIEYSAVYERRFEVASSVSITSTCEGLSFTINGETPTETYSIDVPAGGVITIVVTDVDSAQTNNALTLYFTITPAVSE